MNSKPIRPRGFFAAFAQLIAARRQLAQQPALKPAAEAAPPAAPEQRLSRALASPASMVDAVIQNAQRKAEEEHPLHHWAAEEYTKLWLNALQHKVKNGGGAFSRAQISK